MAYASITEAVKAKREELEAQHQALRAAQQAVLELEAELRAWTEAEALLSKSASTFQRPSSQPEISADSEVRKAKKRATRKRGASKTKRARAPKGYWVTTMEKLAQTNKDFVLSDVSQTAAGLGTELNAAAIRSQMAHYVTSKVLVRVKNGVFRFTPEGRSAFLKKEGNAGVSEIFQNSSAASRAFPGASQPSNWGIEEKLNEIA